MSALTYVQSHYTHHPALAIPLADVLRDYRRENPAATRSSLIAELSPSYPVGRIGRVVFVGGISPKGGYEARDGFLRFV